MIDRPDGITTPDQAKRQAKFTAALERMRTDGHFVATCIVKAGEIITIDYKDAVIARTEKLDDGNFKVYFRWANR
jgi:hypothetical protein